MCRAVLPRESHAVLCLSSALLSEGMGMEEPGEKTKSPYLEGP